MGVIHHMLKKRPASFPPQFEGKCSLRSAAADPRERGLAHLSNPDEEVSTTLVN